MIQRHCVVQTNLIGFHVPPSRLSAASLIGCELKYQRGGRLGLDGLSSEEFDRADVDCGCG